MPIKSQVQRRWMWANDPKMARRWEKHTLKGEKLPKRIGEAPHVETDVGETIDLRIETMSIPASERRRIMRDFQKTGFVGELHGQLIHFKSDHTAEPIDYRDAERLPRLPAGWERNARIVRENLIPKMSEVFAKGK